MELRCLGKKHAEIIAFGSGLVEIKCDSRLCGATAGMVVLHRWNMEDGKLVKTQVFKAPKLGKKELQ
jgi:hypothetical protein